MSTSLRPRRVPNFTTPSLRANSVSSLPLPTLKPGCHLVPRWRMMIVPAETVSPLKRFTPRRCAVESRPLREDEAPFFFDISLLPFADAGDLDGRVLLAVAP